MLTVSVEEWIGKAAAVLSGVGGAGTRRSEQSGSSRTAISSHAQRVVEAVAHAQATGVSYEALWAENERLRAEHDALWQVWSETATRSEAKQRAFAAAGTAMGLRRTQIVVVLTIVVPVGRRPRRATVGRWVRHSPRQSHRMLAVLERACQRVVLVGCLDAIFLHRPPIVLGVAPISWVWWAGHRGPERSGESGWEVMEQGPHLAHVMADGGQGRERGVTLANAARRQAQMPAGDVPVSIPMGLDVLHTQREVERGCQRVWNRVEGQREAAVKAEARREQAKRRGQAPRGGAGHAGRSWRKAARLLEEAVQAHEAVEQRQGALAWGEAAGHLYARAQAPEPRNEASRQLHGDGGKKAKRRLRDARTRRHLERRHAPWSSAIAEPRLRAALVHVGSLLRRLKQAAGDDRVHGSQVGAMACVLCGRLCPDWKADAVKVDELLSQAVRARSAGAGVNSVVRRHPGRHRHVSQGRLDLKRRYGNCRAFEGGKRKGRSPYELLGLQLPTSDWWQLLQMDPQEFEQKLLTQ
jgi:hypothetical protein